MGIFTVRLDSDQLDRLGCASRYTDVPPPGRVASRRAHRPAVRSLLVVFRNSDDCISPLTLRYQTDTTHSQQQKSRS